MVNALRGQGPIQSSIRKVIEGIEWSLRQFSSWKAVHTRRGYNRAAHILAKNAKGLDDCIVWVEDTPLVQMGRNLKPSGSSFRIWTAQTKLGTSCGGRAKTFSQQSLD